MLTPDEKERFEDAKLSSSISGNWSVSGTTLSAAAGVSYPQGAVVTATPATSTNSLASAVAGAVRPPPVAVTYDGTGLDAAQGR